MPGTGFRAHHKPGVVPQFTDAELLDELRLIWSLVGTERLSVAQYRGHGGVHSISTYLSRFGSWAMACHLAAQPPAPEPTSAQRKRRCLACDVLFMSESPGHRICPRHEKSRHDAAQGGAPMREGTLRVPVERDGWRV